MPAHTRYLTKSRFKLAAECPRKLFYDDRPNEYANLRRSDPFLDALVEGGYQVGALARAGRPTGVEIEDRDPDAAVARTTQWLEKENVTLFEAALRVDNLLVRVDVLEKRGNRVDLLEVKAKSFDPKLDSFYGSRDPEQLRAEWKSYLLDVAFQTYVARRALPKLSITPYLLLVDKTAVATVDGLHERFRVTRDGSGVRVLFRAKGGAIDLGHELLTRVPVDDAVETVLKGSVERFATFDEAVRAFASFVTSQTAPRPALGTQCKNCEFRVEAEDLAPGTKSGFAECWQREGQLSADDVTRPFVFDVWNFRGAERAIADGTYLAKQLTEEDLRVDTEAHTSELSAVERRWLQVQKIRDADPTPYIDRTGLGREMSRWRFPYHLIDFETTMVAIPMHKGRRPYEQIAFQFSHHVLDAHGRVAHVDQFLSRETGSFPNFEFVRALRRSLSTDDGSIFRYASHERTILDEIGRQLRRSNEPDRDELIEWIERVTDGDRAMIDLLDCVKRFYYHPRMGGSNSIKVVLPAVLADSKFLRGKYSDPIYGAAGGIPSLNYVDWQWFRPDEHGVPRDPYSLLPPVFDGLDRERLDELFYGDDSLRDGGAAMTAFARMQFSEMSATEREGLCGALLKYCELDTLAMVMILEAWRAEV